MRRRLLTLARRWPLTGFFIAGGTLFVLTSAVIPYGREPIVIDDRTMDGVVERRADELGRDLSAEEREAAIQRFVDEEILIREAHRLGLHLASTRARDRLLRRMRLALSQGLPEPSRAQLRAYYGTSATRYQTDEAVTFAHVFYSADATRPAPETVLRALNAGVNFTTLGERFWLGDVLERAQWDRLAAAFGVDFAQRVFASDDQWTGPITSSRGVHYIRVLERHAPVIPEFDLVEPAVRMEWINDKRADIMERRLSRIRERYEVRLPQ